MSVTICGSSSLFWLFRTVFFSSSVSGYRRNNDFTILHLSPILGSISSVTRLTPGLWYRPIMYSNSTSAASQTLTLNLPGLSINYCANQQCASVRNSCSSSLFSYGFEAYVLGPDLSCAYSFVWPFAFYIKANILNSVLSLLTSLTKGSPHWIDRPPKSGAFTHILTQNKQKPQPQSWMQCIVLLSCWMRASTSVHLWISYLHLNNNISGLRFYLWWLSSDGLLDISLEGKDRPAADLWTTVRGCRSILFLLIHTRIAKDYIENDVDKITMRHNDTFQRM